jgi:mRNA interferase RelE/StbE
VALKYEIDLDHAAIEDLQTIRAFDRRKIMDTIERVLSANPTQLSKSRIKRLRGLDSPAYRLRVDEFRVFYNVEESLVHVLRVLKKADVNQYLKEIGYETEGD